MAPRNLVAVALLLALGCEKKSEPESNTPSSATQSATPVAKAPASATQAAEHPKEEPPGLEKATVGSKAPAFSLPDLDGRTVSLSDLSGKRIVLEWFNPGCPFVNLSHTKGSLKGLAEKYAKQGVVWLAVNSGGAGRQGYGADANRAGRDKLGFDHPILLDESGRVGRAYGATNTPHMFVIDEQGILVYAGAIDNSPDAEGESPTGGTLINYVDAAMEDLDAGRPVRTPKTEAYGCSVKYAEG